MGTQLRYSTVYQSQSNGQTEVVNRCLQNYLRSFVSEEPRSWTKFLYLAEFWYNSSHHSAIGMTPFQALYGRVVPDLHPYHAQSTSSPTIEATFKEHDRLRSVLKANLR